MLWGPTNHFKHLTNAERLPFTITYLLTLFGTIYYSVWVSIFDCFSLLTRCHQSSFVRISQWVFTAFFLCIYSSIKEKFCKIRNCVVEKERRLALPLTRTEGLRTYTTTPGKAWRLAPVTWLVFFLLILGQKLFLYNCLCTFTNWSARLVNNYFLILFNQ